MNRHFGMSAVRRLAVLLCLHFFFFFVGGYGAQNLSTYVAGLVGRRKVALPGNLELGKEA